LVEFIDLQYRFRRNSEHENYMKYLINGKLFNEYKDIMVLSSLIGYENGEYVEFNTPATDRVLMNFFDDADIMLIDLIAYAHTQDQKILFSREKYTIFENYYNGGFMILLRLLELSEYRLSDNDESYLKELTIKLYRILNNYKIYKEEHLEIY